MNTIAFFTNFAGADGLMIFFIILLLFGAKKLPELARGMGQAVNEFNKAKDEIHREITKSEVQVQPAPGQQPHLAAQLPPAPPIPPAVAAATPVVEEPSKEPSHTA